jgi:signal transduction histidine kinase
VMSSAATARKLFPSGPGRAALLDVAIAAVAFAASMALLGHGTIMNARPGRVDPTGVALTAASTWPLLTWRRFPLGVFTVTSAAGVLLAGLGYPVDLLLGPSVALYLLAAGRAQENRWTRRTTFVVVGLFAAYVGALGLGQSALPIGGILHTGLAWAVAWFAGERTRLRRQRQREQLAELRERALRTERDIERERLLAVSEERARIARDLHDSAGHAISVIAVRAGAARLRHRADPDRSLAALEAIEELARQTVQEIDQIVGAMRDGAASDVVEAPIGLASLDALIARHSETGLEISVATSGAPRPLGSAADQAAYRILQEALTNVARHGAGGARIELAYGETSVELSITNPSAAKPSRPGGGHGLIGMRERAASLGGSLDAERSNGTFNVRARIPYGGARG